MAKELVCSVRALLLDFCQRYKLHPSQLMIGSSLAKHVLRHAEWLLNWFSFQVTQLVESTVSLRPALSRSLPEHSQAAAKKLPTSQRTFAQSNFSGYFLCPVALPCCANLLKPVLQWVSGTFRDTPGPQRKIFAVHDPLFSKCLHLIHICDLEVLKYVFCGTHAPSSIFAFGGQIFCSDSVCHLVLHLYFKPCSGFVFAKTGEFGPNDADRYSWVIFA